MREGRTEGVTKCTEKGWIAVASAEHVRAGVAAGIMQVCHGKAAPLRRLRAGDRVAYYSPSATFRGGDRLQAFTAIGRVAASEPYPFETGGGFAPYRREVRWEEAAAGGDRAHARRARLHPWPAQLGLSVHRFGLFEVDVGDLARIAAAMRAALVA